MTTDTSFSDLKASVKITLMEDYAITQRMYNSALSGPIRYCGLRSGPLYSAVSGVDHEDGSNRPPATALDRFSFVRLHQIPPPARDGLDGDWGRPLAISSFPLADHRRRAEAIIATGLVNIGYASQREE